MAIANLAILAYLYLAPLQIEVTVVDGNGDAIIGAAVVATENSVEIPGTSTTTDNEGKCMVTVPEKRDNVKIDVSVPFTSGASKRYIGKVKKVQGSTMTIVLEEE